MDRDPMAREQLSLRPFLIASLILHLIAALVPVGRMPPEPEAPAARPGSPADAGQLGRHLAALGMNPISVVELLVSGERGVAAAPSLAEEPPEEVVPEVEEPPEIVPEDEKAPVVVEPPPAVPPPGAPPSGPPEIAGGVGMAPGAPGEGAPGEPGPGGNGGDEGRLVPPVVIAISWPEYPEGARKLSAIPVVLEVHVDVRGAVDSVRVETSVDCPPCVEAARASAWTMRFRPATLGGRPVPAWTRVPVTFRRR